MDRNHRRFVTAIALLVVLLGPLNARGFGPTGHRIVGRIAEFHLNAQARLALTNILKAESLAEASTWPDEIRSDPNWDHARSWHFVTIEDGDSYETSEKNPSGDVVEAIQRFVNVLKDPRATTQEKAIAIRWLVHLVADVHQPLHVGRGGDRGGNSIDVEWFGEQTNLHHLWDSDLIDSTQLSFSEYAQFINKASEKQIRRWQDSTVDEWVTESIGYRERVYTVPESGVGGSYRYAFRNIPLIELRLEQAGVRLAGLLNSILDDGGANASTVEALGQSPSTLKGPGESRSGVKNKKSAEKQDKNRKTGNRQKQTKNKKAKKQEAVDLQSESSNLNSTLWVQRSAEYAATTTAAFQQAERMIDAGLDEPTWTALPAQVARNEVERNRLVKLPTAIILDVDETVLDNSPYAAWRITANKPYQPETWNRWVADKQAKAIPGAVNLIDHARQRGVAVFYVTNRDFQGNLDENRNGTIDSQEHYVDLQHFTIANLRRVGLLPQEGLSDDDSLLLKGERPDWASEKVNRRRSIAERYRVLLLIGDSLGDFAAFDDQVDLYERFKSPAERQIELRKHRHRWGETWIQLPNPTYGKWLPDEIVDRIKALDVWGGPAKTTLTGKKRGQAK